MCRKALSCILTVAMVMTLFISISITANAQPPEYNCQIVETSTEYATLDAALSAVSSGQTIQLLTDINYSESLYVENINLLFDLNGYTLSLSSVEDWGHGLEVGEGGSVDIDDSNGGELNVFGNNASSNYGVGLYIHDGGSAIVTNITSYGWATGADCTGGSLTVQCITQNGSGHGIYAQSGTHAIVQGDIYAGGTGAMVSWDETLIEIEGDVHAGGQGLSVNGGTIRIDGDVYSSNYGGVSVWYEGTAEIGGNVVSSSFGAKVTGGGSATIEGTMTGSPYVKLDDIDTSADDFTINGDGYYRYSDDSGNLVRVKITTCLIDGCETSLADGGFTEYTEIDGEIYYHVSTAEQLEHISEHRDLNFIQTEDINLAGKQWIPIGWVASYYDTNLPFNGHYDGQDHSISNMTIQTGISWAGLFAIVGANAVVESIVLDDVDITAGYHSGALTGENRGYIAECTVSGSIEGVGQLGGLVGMSHNALLEDCHSSATVTGTGEIVGGLVGYSTNGSGSAVPSIISCSNTGSVSGNEKTGGIVGTLQGGLLAESFAVGDVSSSRRYTGGLVGTIDSANGFVAVVENCYARTSVTSSNTSYVGGLAGANWYGTIRNSYAAGTISLDGVTDAGGLTGTIYSGAITQYSYYDADICGLSDSDKGTPKSTNEMKDLATFSTWSFPDVWTLSDDNSGYPALSWQGFVHGSLSNDSTLSNLTASSIVLTPTFESAVTSYSGNASNSINSTTISATASDGSAAISINGTAGTSKLVALNVGNNVITIEVTAEDEVTTETYTITITRASSTGGGGGGGGGTSFSTGKQLTISTPGGGTIITGTLTESENKEQITIGGTQFGKLVNANQGAVIPASSATVSFDQKAVNAINGASSTGDVVLTIEKIDPSTLTEEQQKRVGDRPVYNFTLTKGGMQISGFDGGRAKISIPYTLGPGENPNQVVIYYLTSDGTLKTVNGHYDADSKCVIFETTHFSTFAVGYNPVSYGDVASDAWYKDAVDFIASRGITSGTGNGAFGPDAALTRGQFIVLLMNAYGLSSDTTSAVNVNFVDAGSTYYTNYLLAAKSLGIVNGVGNNMFAPEQAITRQEMFVMLYNALKILEDLPQTSGDKQFSDFDDANQVAFWAQEAMSALIEGGVISGNDGILNPDAFTTRAEMTQMLYNLLSK